MPPVDLVGDDAAVQIAHAAFRSTAERRLHTLQKSGVQGGAASSLLLDEMIAPRELADPRPGKKAGARAPPSSSASLQHVVACTGASAAQASKILLLREEISRLRRDGHSTATLIEQLRERLHDVEDERRTPWGDDEAENAEAIGGWAEVDRGAGGSKKRRMGDDACSMAPGLSEERYSRKAGRDPFPPGENDRPHEPHSPGGQLHANLPQSSPRAACPPSYCAELGELGGGMGLAPHEKRHREERETAPLSQLKKLKLRAQAEG